MDGKDLQAALSEAESALQRVENEHGSDHILVAERLENYARLLRQARTRLLDAANMEARAKVIHSKHVVPASSESMDEDSDTKPCPFCAETIKQKAVICRFCNRDLQKRQKFSRVILLSLVLTLLLAAVVLVSPMLIGSRTDERAPTAAHPGENQSLEATINGPRFAIVAADYRVFITDVTTGEAWYDCDLKSDGREVWYYVPNLNFNTGIEKTELSDSGYSGSFDHFEADDNHAEGHDRFSMFRQKYENFVLDGQTGRAWKQSTFNAEYPGPWRYIPRVGGTAGMGELGKATPEH